MSFSRNRWDQSIRRLWHIFVLLRSHFSPQNPERRANLRRAVGSPPTNSGSPTVICACQLPPTPIPIAGGDAPVVVSLMSDPTQIRQATIPDPETTSDKSHENGNTDPLGHVDADGGRPFSSLQRQTCLIHVEPPHCKIKTTEPPILPQSLHNSLPQSHQYKSIMRSALPSMASATVRVSVSVRCPPHDRGVYCAPCCTLIDMRNTAR